MVCARTDGGTAVPPTFDSAVTLTVTGSDAARLYERLGWQRVGEIPDYALMPRGGLVATTVYYRRFGG